MTRLRISLVLLLISGLAYGESPYYPGTYPGENSTAPSASPNPPPPPVVYRRVPVARPVYVVPEWASPRAAALAPWPWNFEFGGGPTVVTGSNNDLSSGSNFLIGGGYNFNPQAGWVLEFSQDWLGLSDSAIQRAGATDGNSSIWSVTLNPIWRFRLGGPLGGYIIGGGGYYERTEKFVAPAVIIDPIFGPLLVNQEFRQTDDAGGVDIGAGLTCNLGWGTKFFVEARYNHIFTPGSGTEIIPITFGLRW